MMYWNCRRVCRRKKYFQPWRLPKSRSSCTTPHIVSSPEQCSRCLPPFLPLRFYSHPLVKSLVDGARCPFTLAQPAVVESPQDSAGPWKLVSVEQTTVTGIVAIFLIIGAILVRLKRCMAGGKAATTKHGELFARTTKSSSSLSGKTEPQKH